MIMLAIIAYLVIGLSGVPDVKGNENDYADVSIGSISLRLPSPWFGRVEFEGERECVGVVAAHSGSADAVPLQPIGEREAREHLEAHDGKPPAWYIGGRYYLMPVGLRQLDVSLQRGCEGDSGVSGLTAFLKGGGGGFEIYTSLRPAFEEDSQIYDRDQIDHVDHWIDVRDMPDGYQGPWLRRVLLIRDLHRTRVAFDGYECLFLSQGEVGGRQGARFVLFEADGGDYILHGSANVPEGFGMDVVDFVKWAFP